MMIRMKRISVTLDEALLHEAKEVFGSKSDSAAVNAALAEVLRVRKILALPSYFGSGMWRGDLGRMREDRPLRTRRKNRER